MKYDIVQFLGKAKDVTKDDLLKTLQFYNASPRELFALREHGKALVIGEGVMKVLQTMQNVMKGKNGGKFIKK